MHNVQRAFLTGCDKETEWMLPWFVENYKKHNSTPLSVVDFGMTDPMLEWLETKVDSIGRIGNHKPQTAWFFKPGAMLNSPYKETCWIDTDCEVMGDMSGVFDHVLPERLAMVQDMPWSRRSGEIWHNSGIVAFTGKPSILKEWAMAIEGNNQRGDQEVLHQMLDPLRRAIYITDLPNKYNYLRIQHLDKDNVVGVINNHWTGSKGKDHIRSLME